MDDVNEYLDVVDENDLVVGKELRSVIYRKKLCNYRVINAFIINSKSELWIPRRTINKSIFPSCLDMSMGGHVNSGETYEQAFAREMNEELNIEIKQYSARLLGYLTPSKDNVSSFMKVFEICMDSVPSYNRNDFSEYYLLTPSALLAKIRGGDLAKDDLGKLVQRLYLDKYNS